MSAWDDIADVVASTNIVTTWGNKVRDQVVHVFALFADVPLAGIVNGSMVFAEDRDVFYGRISDQWKPFQMEGTPWITEDIDILGTKGALFRTGDNALQIGKSTVQSIQAFNFATHVVEELRLQPLGGRVFVGSARRLGFDGEGANGGKILFADPTPNEDSLAFDDGTNTFQFMGDGVLTPIVKAGVFDALTYLNTSGDIRIDGIGVISSGRDFVGQNVIMSPAGGNGVVSCGVIGCTSGTVQTDWTVSGKVITDLVHANSGTLTLRSDTGDARIDIGSGASRFFDIQANMAAQLFRISYGGVANSTDVRFPTGIPVLGGMIDVGIVAGSEQIGKASSSAIWKENIKPIGESSVWKLRPVSFKWNTGLNNEDKGFIAEEVELVDPLLVTRDEYAKAFGINRTAILAEVVAGLQELKRSLDALNASNN